jgi:hypothetical protein
VQRSKLRKKCKIRRRNEHYVEMINIRRDSNFQKHKQGPSHQDSQKDQRSRPLTLRHSSKLEEIISLGGGVTVDNESKSR